MYYWPILDHLSYWKSYIICLFFLEEGTKEHRDTLTHITTEIYRLLQWITGKEYALLDTSCRTHGLENPLTPFSRVPIPFSFPHIFHQDLRKYRRFITSQSDYFSPLFCSLWLMSYGCFLRLLRSQMLGSLNFSWQPHKITHFKINKLFSKCPTLPIFTNKICTIAFSRITQSRSGFL